MDIILGGGLDRITPKALVPPGRLEDCFNYEVGIQPGYQPSSGFERFDGHISPSTRDIWDLVIDNSSITSAYSGNSLAMPQNTAPVGLAVSSDGSKMYMLGATATARVYQYTLPNAWSLDNSKYRTKFASVAAETTAPTSLAFSNDGTKMYVSSTTVVYQYTLTTAWDVSTASYASKSVTVSGTENVVSGIAVSDDGTALYVVGTQNDTIYQFTMSTPDDISTATYASKSVAIPAGETAVTGIHFADSGQRLYIVGATLGLVHQFTCATAWDVSTASDDSFSFRVAGEDSSPQDIFFKPDGLQYYVVGTTNDTAYHYYWSFLPNENMTWTKGKDTGDLGVVISTTIGSTQTTIRFAYWKASDARPSGALVTGDVSGTTFTDGFYYTDKSFVSAQNATNGVTFNDDGTKMYLMATTVVYQYTLTVAWDVSTAAYATISFDTTAETSSIIEVQFNDDGTKMYVLDAALDDIFQYTLGTPWDVSTASYASKSLDCSSEDASTRGFSFKTDGTEVYTVGSVSKSAHQYTLSSAWDISTATLTNTLPLGLSGIDAAQEGTIMFIGTGLLFYVTAERLDTIYEYACSTAWDLSTGALTGVTFSIANQTNDTNGLFITSDGRSIFIQSINGSDSTTYQYDYFTSSLVLTALEDVATSAGDYFDQLYAASTVLRTAITPAPGSGPVSGIKWYKNQEYAVRDYYKYNFKRGDISELQVGQHVLIMDGYAEEIYGDEGIIRDMDLNQGSFAQGDGAGTIVIEPYASSFDFGTRLVDTDPNVLVPLIEFYFISGSTEPTVDQILRGQTSSNDVYVYRVEIQTGAWADGDATGVIYCYQKDGTFTAAELIDRVSPAASNIMTFNGSLHASSGSRVGEYQSEDHSGHALAGLYRTSRAGFEKIDLGSTVRFDTGTNEPTPIQFGADTSSQSVTTTDWEVAKAQRDLTGWTPSAGSELDAVGASGGAYVLPDDNTGHGDLEESAFFFAVHDFQFNLPEGARVVGVEIEITAANTDAASFGAALRAVQPYLNDTDVFEGGSLDGVLTRRQAIGDLTASQVAYTFGGENDLWGAAIDKDVVENSAFGVKFRFEWQEASTGPAQQCDLIRMRIHYVEQGSPIYFYDTVALADYTSARLVHLNVESGTWAGNDAIGTLQLYDLRKIQIPTKNIQIRDAAAGGGNLIGNLVGNESLVHLAGSALVKAQKAKYQMIAENVYARDDLEAIYAVSGAGPAFSYDGFYVRLVHSGLSPDLDKPRHLALFQFRLWLAYGFGEMAISVAGNPLSFDGSLNAVASGFGRRITGLAQLAGKTMGVLTDQSTYAVTVDGADFDQQIFAPKVGAIEYTVQDAGSSPMYVDARGFATPETTDKYGDFELGRMSKMVHPWLLPRLQGKVLNSTRDERVVGATVSRLKNQYRLYFADGVRMTMTLALGDQLPQVTWQKLYTDNTPSQHIRVLATDSDVDDGGTDRMFFTMDINPDYDHGADIGYVYEEDRGTSYDGSAYTRWLEISPLSDGRIDQNTIWSVWHLYGEAHGHAALNLTTALDFAHPADADTSTEDANYDVKLGKTTNAATSKQNAYFDKNRVKRRGRHLSMRLQGNSDRELPHLLQNIALVNEKPGRPEE